MSNITSNYSNSYAALAANASKVAGNLTAAEENYASAAKSGDKAKLIEAEMIYQQNQESFDAIMQMLKNKFETMRQLIRNMALN